MDNDIKIQFLGGANEVGNAAMVLEMDELKLLFEYGLSPGKPPRFPMPAPPVDRVMLTHAHLDHSGMIPWLCAQGTQTIFATEITSKVSNLLHKDTVKISRMDGYAIPFDINDVKEAQHSFIRVDPNKKKDLGENAEVCFHSAGHIPGSIMYQVKGSRTVLFTGDINVIDTKLVKAAKPAPCDILCMESTYAGREHPKRSELEKRFLDRIEEVVGRGGVVVIPAFAVSRSQEIILVLKNAGYNVWFDGMGRKVSKLFLKHPEYLKSPDDLRKAMNAINLVHSDHGRKLALKSEVILTSSGMMDGGPVLWYMNHLKDDPKSAVFLTGYQVPGSNSKLLREKGKLDFYGVQQKVECEVDYFDFSAHAGHNELIEFAKACKPQKIVLFHSDNRTPLLEPLRQFAEVYTPTNGETFSV